MAIHMVSDGSGKPGQAVEMTPAQETEITGKWNTPRVLSPRKQREALFLPDADRADIVNRLKTNTPQQIKDYVAANSSNVAQLRTLVTRLMLTLAVLVQK